MHSLPGGGLTGLGHGSVSAETVLFTGDGSVRLAGFGLPIAPDHVPAELEWNARAPSRGDDAAYDLDALSDQFAVGLLLLQLKTDQDLEARVPLGAHDGERAAAVDALLHQLDLRDPLTPALLRLLAPNPAHRFESAEVAADALAHLEGPFADAALRTLARKLVASAERQDRTDPEGAPAGLISRALPIAAPGDATERTAASTVPPQQQEPESAHSVSPSRLEHTDAQEEAGQASAVHRAFYEQSNTMDAIRPEGRGAMPAEAPVAPGGDASRLELDAEVGDDLVDDDSVGEDGHDDSLDDRQTDGSLDDREGDDSLDDRQTDGSLDDREGDDSLDVWAAGLESPVSPLVEEDSDRLTPKDLERPSPEWFLDGDVDESELASTIPNGSTLENARAAQSAVDRRPPLEPSRTIPYSPAFVPKAATFNPTDSGSMGEFPLNADGSGNFAAATATGENPELPPGAQHLLSGVHEAIAPRWTLENPIVPAEQEGEELDLGPHDEDDQTTPFIGEPLNSERLYAIPALKSVAEPRPAPPESPPQITMPGAAPTDRVQQRRRRRRERKGQGASTRRSSVPRLWIQESVWNSSPVVRGVVLGVFLLLLLGLVEGVRRRWSPPPPVDALPAAEAPELLE